VLNESDQRVLAGKSPSISASRTHGSIDTAAAALDLISFLEGKARELAVSGMSAFYRGFGQIYNYCRTHRTYIFIISFSHPLTISLSL